ncbi:MAG: hypothetical protein RL572_1771 [Pseudomonadota bacterium]|jgi:hypothetical protein
MKNKPDMLMVVVILFALGVLASGVVQSGLL